MGFNILIIGCNGQLGEILYNLLSKSFKVHGTSNCKNNINNYDFLNITDSTMVNNILKKYNPNIIINTAAITDVDFCEMNKKKCHNVNVFGLQNLIKFSNTTTKIIHFSSDFVYDGKSIICSELTTPNPSNYYGKTKLESENILIGSNRRYLILRISTLYSYKDNNFFTWVYNSLNDNKEINVVTDQVVSPSYANFLALSLRELILLDANGLYNYGSADNISKYDFSINIASIFNLNKSLINKVQSNKLSFKAIRPHNTILDCSKINHNYDIYLPYIDECLQHLKENYYE